MASLAFPSITKKTTLKDGTRYGYVYVAAKGAKPTVLLLHGYPSAAYDWRYQIELFSDAGYGVIAPDLLGYGDTDKPSDLEPYSQKNIASQVIEILDIEGLDQVVGIGHDWGCGLLSAVAHFFDSRISVYIFLAVAYLPHSFADIDALNEQTEQAVGYPLFGYWKFHDRPDAGAIIDKQDPRIISRLIYPAKPEYWIEHVCKYGGIEKWVEEGTIAERASYITAEEEEMHDKILQIGGYQPPLNWYRQAMAGITKRDEDHLTEEDRIVKKPLLFVGAEKDYICIPDIFAEGMKGYVNDVTIKKVDATHWLMIEKKEECFEIMQQFLKEKLGV